MSPSQLAQVVCALAAAGASKHIQLVSLTAPLSRQRALVLELVRSCHGAAAVAEPLPLTANASATPPDEVIKNRFPRGTTDVLFLAHLSSATDVSLLNERPVRDLTSVSRWLLIVQPNMSLLIMEEFHGQINNKVVFLEGAAPGAAWEAYRTDPGEQVVYQSLGTVSVPPLQEQIDVLRKDPWYRRTNLTGFTLRCSLKNYAPFAVVHQTAGRTVRVTGLLGDVMDVLQDSTHMRVECREPEDGKWGAIRPPDGNWVGVLGDVFHGRADIALPFYFSMADRQESFDFSHPIGEDWIVLVIQRPRALDGSNNFTRELTTQTWAAIFILFCMSVCFSKLLTSYCRSEAHSSWGQNFITNVRIFCNMGWGELPPRRTPFRTWTLTLLLVVMVLHVSYSSSLITILTSNRLVLPFTDLQGLYDTGGEYTVGFEIDSVMDKMFKVATSGLFKRLREDLISKHPEFVEEISEGLARVIRNPRHTYLISKLLVPKKDCRLLALPPKLYSSQMSMMMAKKLPAAPIINYILLRMHESGLLQRLLRKHELVEDAAQSIDSRCSSQLATPMGLGQTYTALCMLVAGYSAALVILFCEILLMKAKMRNS